MQKRVLMFGWEFPPFVTGGLGAACYGLVKAMLKRNLDITLVLPKSIPNAVEEGFTVFGVDNWEFCLKELQKKEELSVKTLRVNSPIQAYSGASSPIDLSILSKEALRKLVDLEKNNKNKTIAAQKNINLYGNNLLDEVFKYNETAASIAGNLDFDVIHCHDWLTFGAGIIAKQLTGKPLVVHVHCTEFDRCPGYGNEEVHKLEKSGCDYADLVITVSQYTKQVLINKYGIPSEKIEVVYNGIDSKDGFPEPKEFKSHNPKVLFLGRVTYQKGPNYFIESAAKVINHRPDAEFLVAGSGDMLDYMKARAYELGISENVKFLGAISADKVEEIYRDVDCFILSSVSEPFGLTVLESISQRVPTIVTKQSGVSELLRHVLRYDFWDIEHLTSLVLSMITYAPLAQELKERGVDDLYSINWGKAAERVHNLYNRFSGIHI